MKALFLYFPLLLAITQQSLTAQGPFAPAAGKEGTTAIHMNSAEFISWATHIQVERGYINISDTTVTHNGCNKASFGEDENALGPASGNSYDAVSLGDAGYAILQFDRPIVNGEGYDFAVFENSFSDSYLELAFVEVSSDGERFVRFPALSLTPSDTQVGGFGNLDPTYIHNFAGKYRAGYGTPFDLNDLKDSTDIDINNIRYVKIIDVVGCIDCGYGSYDSEGTIVNDPWPTPFDSGGFDLEAVGVINAGEPYNPTSVYHNPQGSSTIYPNPFSYKLRISAEPNSQLSIYDINGKRVLQKETTPDVLMLDHLLPGYYILKITNNTYTQTFKILKQ